MSGVDWRLISILITIFIFWSGLLVGTVRWLLTQHQKHIDLRFTSLEETGREESRNWQKVERDILSLRAELPEKYVRREDAIRTETVIYAKLDGLSLKLDKLKILERRDDGL